MLKIFFSMKAAVVIMLVFAVAIGAATFIENDYGTQTARALVYNAKWFELLLFYFVAIVIYNIIAFKMYKREKWGQFTLHIAFLFIAVGALLTRFVGYEGILHIREGQTSSAMVSDVMTLEVDMAEKDKAISYYLPVYLTSLGENHLDRDFKLGDKKLNIKLVKYIPAGDKRIVTVPDGGSEILSLKIAGGGRGEDIFLKKGSEEDFGSFILSFEGIKRSNKPILFVSNRDGNLTIDTPFPMQTLNMADRKQGSIPAGINRFDDRKLYRFGPNSIVLRKFYKNAKVEYANNSIKPVSSKPQVVILEVSDGKKSKTVELKGRKGIVGEPVNLDFSGLKVRMSYGAKVIELPFTIKLDKFELERYPGSMSPSSYSSYVTVIDKEKNLTMPYHIYMNHVLDYRGYRFFQSSFDMDEKGSVLSVNHDPGTLITYIGYLLLTIGFLWSFLTPKGRFQSLKKRLHKLQIKGKEIAVLALFALFFVHPTNADAYTIGSDLNESEKKILQSYSREHADKLGKIVVQNSSGRMEPLDTLAHQILSKISRKSSIMGLDADQVLLAMLTKPDIFQRMKMIKISHPLIAKKLGLPKDTKYVSYDDFFDKKTGRYILAEDVQKANRKRSAERDMYDKDLIKADERLNVAYMTFQGALLKIFPKPNDKMHRWYPPIDAIKNFSPKEGQLVRYLVGNYFKNVDKAVQTGDWTEADKALDIIKKFQYFYGSDVIPSQKRIEMEIEYNKLNIFSRLVPVYILVGLILLIFSFVNIVKPSFSLKWPVRISLAILTVAFVLQTIGLGIRWYIADHAPWSNAYESIIYISWATVLAGFVFSKRSPITLAATSILAGIFLFVAHLNWLDPQITNLVPVLKSYWLMIHVAVITASYGFLGLGALLGMFVLILFIVRGKNGNPNIDRAIKELTIINEMTLLIGLALVTVGNFLGGVWANESWGRYWGWDPKETWAAVTILVYAAVVHMRFIPKLKGVYAFNVAAVLAYSSVIMTYFGVNYYLSGMHSYAAGDPVPIPGWVYPAIVSIFILIGLAYRNRSLK